MAFYPFPEALQNIANTTRKGNFGLWYNKFVPLSDKFKPADEKGNDKVPVEHYFERYNQMKNNAINLPTRFWDNVPNHGFITLHGNNS